MTIIRKCLPESGRRKAFYGHERIKFIPVQALYIMNMLDINN